MPSGKLKAVLAFSAAAAALLSCEAAFAQPVIDQVAAAASTTQQIQDVETAARLGEIIVTARRREENVQTVPIAVTVVGGQQISEHM